MSLLNYFKHKKIAEAFASTIFLCAYFADDDEDDER